MGEDTTEPVWTWRGGGDQLTLLDPTGRVRGRVAREKTPEGVPAWYARAMPSKAMVHTEPFDSAQQAIDALVAARGDL